MKMRFKYALIILLGVFTFLASWSQYVVEHENAHSVIFKYYDVDSVKQFDTFAGFNVGGRVTSVNISISPEKYGDMIFLHSLNEVVGYHVGALIFAWFFGIAWLGLVYVCKKNKEK